MALASCQVARSPVALTDSLVFNFQFSSISKTVSNLAKTPEAYQALQAKLLSLYLSYYHQTHPKPPAYYLLQTDTTPIRKPSSPTLKDRGFVHIPNSVIKGNKPIDIGYDLSCINLSCDQWSLPLLRKRVGLDQTSSQCALEQLEQLFDQLALSDKQFINTLDSHYGNAAYLAPSHDFDNLTNVVRLRSSMKVWDDPLIKTGTGGADTIYGEKFYLCAESGNKTYINGKTKTPYDVYRTSVLELTPDDEQVLFTATRSGRELKTTILRFNDLRIRSKDGHNMKDKPFDLLVANVVDATTGKAVFKKEIYLAIAGVQKNDISTQEAFLAYRKRYDIEPSFRYSKQKLMLSAYQTPEVQTLDNWFIVNQVATWLLYIVSDETELIVPKWQSYLPENTAAKDADRLTIAQTRKGAERLFLTYDKRAFLPSKSKKGKGRIKGTKFTAKKRHQVRKKNASKRNYKQKTEHIV